MRCYPSYGVVCLLLCSVGVSFSAPPPGSGAADGADYGRTSQLLGFVALPRGESRLPQTIFVHIRGAGYESSSTTQSNGFFSFSDVPPGDYLIEVRANGYAVTETAVYGWSGMQNGDLVVPLGTPRDDGTPPPGQETIAVRNLKVPPKARREANQAALKNQSGKYQEAVKHLKKAVKIYPEYVDAWTSLGIINARLNHKAEAEAAFQKALDLDPAFPIALKQLGLLYLGDNKADKALPLLTKCSELNAHSDPYAETYLGYALYQTGQYEKARVHLKTALTLKPDLPVALYELGYVEVKLGNFRQAELLLNRFLALDLKDPLTDEVRMALSQLKSERQRQIAEAE